MDTGLINDIIGPVIHFQGEMWRRRTVGLEGRTQLINLRFDLRKRKGHDIADLFKDDHRLLIELKN